MPNKSIFRTNSSNSRNTTLEAVRIEVMRMLYYNEMIYKNWITSFYNYILLKELKCHF